MTRIDILWFIKMEDDSGLELSLGLSFGGSSNKSKGKSGISLDTKPNEGKSDFKSFLQAGIPKQDTGTGSQRNDPVENIFNDNSKASHDADVNNKRKISFDEINNQKKHNREFTCSDSTDKIPQTRTSHICIQDGATAESEDVAESEVGVGSSSEALSLQGQKRNNLYLENDFKLGNMSYGVSYPVQPVNNTVNGHMQNTTYTLPAMMQVTPSTNGERLGTQIVNTGNFKQAFGYSSVQIPMLDKDNSWNLTSHPQIFQSSFAGRSGSTVSLNSDKDNGGSKIPQGDGRHQITEEGSSSQPEDDVKGSTMIFKSKDVSDKSTDEVPTLEGSGIRPGFAMDIKFGGCGSYPNLPWVSTTGPGPNGRTISGVTYRYSGNEIRIVCACHGSHMTPDEFVRHATDDHTNPERSSGLPPSSNSNPATSAQS